MLVGTTPTFTLILPQEYNLTTADKVYFAIRQGNVLIKKESPSGVAVIANRAQVYLSQRDTLRFKKGTAKIQLNWTYSNGNRGGTKVKEIEIDENLLEEVLG